MTVTLPDGLLESTKLAEADLVGELALTLFQSERPPCGNEPRRRIGFICQAVLIGFFVAAISTASVSQNYPKEWRDSRGCKPPFRPTA